MEAGDREKAARGKPSVCWAPGALGQGRASAPAARPWQVSSLPSQTQPHPSTSSGAKQGDARVQRESCEQEHPGRPGHTAPPAQGGEQAPTSACVLQKSASLELFTSQLMTRTSGRQRMFRVWTCRESRTWRRKHPKPRSSSASGWARAAPSLLHSLPPAWLCSGGAARGREQGSFPPGAAGASQETPQMTRDLHLQHPPRTFPTD